MTAENDTDTRVKQRRHAPEWAAPCMRILIRVLLALPVMAICILSIHYIKHLYELTYLSLGLAFSLWISAPRPKALKKLRKWSYGVLCIFCGILILSICLWPNLNKERIPDKACRNPGFSGTVLVLTPHPDDELNLLGGAFEVISKDCDVYVLYYTGATTRIHSEAIGALSRFGIDNGHAIFLNYNAHGFLTPLEHMYNSPREHNTPGRISKKPYNQATFEKELRDIIKSMRPETIVSVDYDSHADHRALGLTAERVLADIMKEDNTYRPTVLKTFAYSCAWMQKTDFYADNIGSTKYMGSGETMEEVNCYPWADRLRIPVGKSSLSRTLVDNLTAKSFNEYVSQQHANTKTNERICNSDKIFWWRPTSHCMWDAEVTADSGDASQLHDFRLYDSKNIAACNQKPYDHGWRPNGGKGTATVSWKTPVKIKEIHLFDQNDTANQVNHLTICLSNGRKISVEGLPPGGARVVVPTECTEALTGFTVTIDDSMGEGSGLAEVEAYTESPKSPISVAKLQDDQGDFMYDYITNPEGDLDFSLYSWGCDAAQLKVQLGEVSSSSVSMQEKGNGYNLKVPRGESCILIVKDEEGKMLDAARVSNPGNIMRTCRRILRALDPVMVSLSWEKQRWYYSAQLDWLLRMIR